MEATPVPASASRSVGSRTRAISLAGLSLMGALHNASARVTGPASMATAVHVTNYAHTESCGKGCTETIDDDDSANSATTTDDGSSSGPDISSLDCTEYDDDATYDSASCLSYDEVACEYNCQEGSFCSELCGDSAVGEYSCGNGAGAVCAMNMLNDLVSTCSLYQQFASNPTPYTKETTSMILADDDLSIGCDDHAYCEFCDDLCQDSFGDLGYAVFGDDLVELKKLGRGPFAMYLLNNMEGLCEQYDNVTVTADDTSTDGSSIGSTAVEEETAVKVLTPSGVELFERFSFLLGSSGSAESTEPNQPTGTVIFGVGGVGLVVVAVVAVTRRRGRYSSVPDGGEFEF